MSLTGINIVSLYIKIILCVFALAYLISPVDVIPDILLPYIGWLDDGVIVATVYYLIRHGRLPDFLFKMSGTAADKERGFHAAEDGSSANQRTRPKNNNDDNQYQNTYKKRKKADNSKTPYEILGLSPGATRSQIQAAYKAAIKKYHPDKLSHLGEEFSSLANEKFLEIQKAYDELMKQ